MPANQNITFVNYDNSSDDITMPATLQQATGSGTSTWTISDSSNTHGTVSQYTSELTLVNQGTIFVNGTDNFTAGSATTNWTLATAGTGNDVFDNEGSIDVIGTSGGGSTTANLDGGLSITGSGYINIYGNAILNIADGVGVSSGQTINFVSANGNTDGQVIEGGGVDDAAKIAGFLTGDTVTVQNLDVGLTDSAPTEFGHSR